MEQMTFIFIRSVDDPYSEIVRFLWVVPVGEIPTKDYHFATRADWIDAIEHANPGKVAL